MIDKLRELAERWKEGPQGDDYLQSCCGEIAAARERCADQILAILDAEGDGGAAPVGLLTIELGRWYVEGIRMEVESLKFPVGIYNLYTHPQPARSGVVSDEQVEEASRIYVSNGGGSEVNGHVRANMRLALEHFTKSQGESHD